MAEVANGITFNRVMVEEGQALTGGQYLSDCNGQELPR
jgi:hypothetical protein